MLGKYIILETFKDANDKPIGNFIAEIDKIKHILWLESEHEDGFMPLERDLGLDKTGYLATINLIDRTTRRLRRSGALNKGVPDSRFDEYIERFEAIDDYAKFVKSYNNHVRERTFRRNRNVIKSIMKTFKESELYEYADNRISIRSDTWNIYFLFSRWSAPTKHLAYQRQSINAKSLGIFEAWLNDRYDITTNIEAELTPNFQGRLSILFGFDTSDNYKKFLTLIGKGRL